MGGSWLARDLKRPLKRFSFVALDLISDINNQRVSTQLCQNENGFYVATNRQSTNEGYVLFV